MGIHRIDLDWDKPLLPAVSEGLLKHADGALVDLSNLMVVVPTGQSGRRLREALALNCNENGTGLLSPQILTPDQLLKLPEHTDRIASDAIALAAWVSVLGKIDLSQFKALFPVEPLRSTGWQLGMAQRLQQLRAELGEAGLSISDAAEKAAQAGHEPERWRQLSRLDGLYKDALQHRQLQDAQSAIHHQAKTYKAPKGIERIIVVATPDPLPLTLQALQNASAETTIEIWTYGPRELFDEWGLPRTEIWLSRPLDLENWNCQLLPKSDPNDTATAISKRIAKAQPESALIGLVDPHLNPVVHEALATAGIASFDPEGQALNLSAVGRLAELLCLLHENAELSTVRSLVQHPDLFKWLQSKADQSTLLKRLDRVFENHLTADLSALLNFTLDEDLRSALEKLKAIEQRLQQISFGEAMAAVLNDIYSKQSSPTADFADSAHAIRQICQDSREAEAYFKQLPADFGRSAFRQRLKSSRIYPDRPKDAHDLLGWLELLWNDAPHLILAGFNEGIVPESVVGDAFLPESLRTQLGLRTNTQRFARDTYLLEAMCRRRASADGQIDLLTPKAAADGSPLKPSRILFQGSDAKLLSRTQSLFADRQVASNIQSHSFPWKLSPPPDLPSPESLSVSALRTYLECPFRFFLKHILKMRTVDASSRELTPASFGTLFHDTIAHLEGMTLDEKSPPAELVKKLHAILEREIQHQFGKQLSFALRLQQEALIARVDTFVDKQIDDIQENGSLQICATEHPFEMAVEGVTIRGTIDRIDQRNGHIELIDYKTADTPKTPQQAHLKRVGKKGPLAHLPPEAFFEHEGKCYQWTDLQLPLYLLSQTSTGSERPKLAYFNLARTQEKSGMAPWDDFTLSHLESAQACAKAIVRQIKAGIFWPANTDVRENFDDFAPFFPDGIEHSVDAAAFLEYSFK